MDNPIDGIKSWRTADPELMLKKLRKEVMRKKGGRWIFTDKISPLDLYTYLKARFGAPNGFQMTLKNPSSDNYIQWHWTLQTEDNTMEFMGFNMHAEVFLEGYPDFAKVDGERLESGLKEDFKNHGPAMSKVRKGLEKWNLFINPYNRLRKVVDQFSNKLRDLRINELVLPKQPHTSKELKSFEAKFKKCNEKYTEALGLSTSLRMLAPILAESFVNLVIFLLAKPDIKKDKRLYDDVLRREIDIRVKSLHLVCEGFVRAVGYHSTEFKDFQTLMNRRNDFLHGNIDPKKLKYDVVHFDGNTPVPKEYKNFSELALVNSLIHVEPEVALHDVDVVNMFINFILDHLDASIRRVVEMLMQTSDPGWRDDTMRVGILFPPYLVHGVPGSTNREGHAAKLGR